MCIRIDARWQNSKAIKGSVFESMRNGSTKNDYIIISDTDYNMDVGMAICSMVVPYTDSEKNNKYAIPFEMIIGNMVQKYCVLTNTQYIFKVTDLKYYKYHVNQDLIDEIDRSFMNIIFGKRLYTITECRQAVAEDDIKLRVKYENQTSGSTSIEKVEEVPQVENFNMSLEDQQNYYAQMYTDDYTNELPLETPKKISKPTPSKTEAFNTVIPKDFKFEEPEVKAEVKKPIAKLDKAKDSDKKKAKVSKSKTGANIVVVGGKKKAEKTKVKKEISVHEPTKAKRSYVDRSGIWAQPELFLLDVHQKTRPEIMEIYSINTWPQAITIISKCTKLCEERGIDISFMKKGAKCTQ